MKYFKYVPLLFCCFSLNACLIMENMRDELEDVIAGDFTPSALGASEKLLASPCPQVELVDDLSSISDFKNPNKQFKENLISRVDLKRAESTCNVSANSVLVDLTLIFNGKLGPQGRQKSSDKPFFSYPYFIAVTSPTGKIMAKEIFAASMTYSTDENEHSYFENLRQIIPIVNKAQARNYKVLIGFQVTPDQLAYNRENMIPAKHAAKIKPVIPPSLSKESN